MTLRVPRYACTFAGWALAAVFNPMFAKYFPLGFILAAGALLQLVSHCMRPWGPFPLYCLSFFVQAVGMALQDSHSNTFVSSVGLAHRWLGFIHASYAAGLLVGEVSPSLSLPPASTPRLPDTKVC